MSKAADSLQRRFGANLSESLGVRTGGEPTPPRMPSPGGGFPGETAPDDGRTRAREAGHMEVERIVPDPDQPRKEFKPEALDRLAASLLKHGQLQPIRVRWNAGLGKWVVISGERRFRAAVQAGLRTVACIFTDGTLTPSEILQEQMVENCLREDLTPTEQARAYRAMMEAHGWTAEQLAGELNVSESAISKAFSVLRLPADLQDKVDSREIPATAAYELAKLPDAPAQREMARRVVDEGMTRDKVAAEVKVTIEEAKAKAKGAGVPAKGRGAKAGPPKPKAFKVSGGTILVTMKRDGSDAAIVGALRELLDRLEPAADDQAAA